MACLTDITAVRRKIWIYFAYGGLDEWKVGQLRFIQFVKWLKISIIKGCCADIFTFTDNTPMPWYVTYEESKREVSIQAKYVF